MIIVLIIIAAVSATVVTQINLNKHVVEDFVTLKTIGDSFAEGEIISLELENKGEEPIYYHDTACGGSIKILRNGVFQKTRIFECLYNGEGELLLPGEKVILYDQINEAGTYKRTISYSLEKSTDAQKITTESNEFYITE